MNKVFIVGNLTRDPELRTTQNGTAVCSFNVAVNKRMGANAQHPEADYFRVTAWRGLAENCAKFLAKGRKVAVTGAVSVSTYQANNGTTKATLDVTADDVEFLSPKGEASESTAVPEQRSKEIELPPSDVNGFVVIDDDDSLPF